jgi:hypothetical protein
MMGKPTVSMAGMVHQSAQGVPPGGLGPALVDVPRHDAVGDPVVSPRAHPNSCIMGA